MKFLNNKIIKQIITILIVVVVGYFFYKALNNNWQAVQEIDFSFNWLSVAAILMFFIAVVESGYLWGKMLNSLTVEQGKHIKLMEAIKVQIASWLLKYVPGQAGSAVNKVVWAKRKGYSKKLVLVTFIYENIFLLVGSFLLSIPILMILDGDGVFSQNPIYLLILPLAILFSVFILNNKSMHIIMNYIFSKILKQPVGRELFLSNWELVKYQIHYLLPRFLNGVGFVFVVTSFLDVSTASYMPLGAAYILGGAIGMMAVFVPSGIGVREATVVIFVSQYMSPGEAIIAAIVARLYSTIADGLLALWYGLLKTKKGKIMS